MNSDGLEERLHRQLRCYETEIEKVAEEKFCLLPMGVEMQVLRQRVVAFDGASALEHRATA